MSTKITIVTGGYLEEEFVLHELRKRDVTYLIAVDKGMEFLYHHNILPNYVVGDFDSADQEVVTFYRNEPKVTLREYNPVKDATDTEIAIRLAMALRCNEICILGATGGRIDHLWSNIQCLSIPCKAGVHAEIMDSQNYIRVISETTVLERSVAYGPYFSLFPLDGEIFNLRIRGAKYELDGVTVTPYNSLCVSNQFAEEEVEISFANGMMVLMQTRD